MTKEERAKEYTNNLVDEHYEIDPRRVLSYEAYCDVEKSYIQGATDQDPISRADERKKVIDKVCDYFRENCYDHYDAPWIVENGINHFLDYMRKAMEE